MGASGGEHAGFIQSSLLEISRDPAHLERALLLFLSKNALQKLAKGAGRRLPGRPDPAAQLAGLLPKQPRLAQQVAEAMATALAAEDTSGPEGATSALAQWMLQKDHAGEEFAPLLKACAEEPTAEERRAPRQAQENAKPGAKAKPDPSEDLAAEIALAREQKDNQRLKEQLAQVRRILSERQDELGLLRKDFRQAEENLERAVAERRDAEHRASARKRQLQDATASSDREEQLELALESARRELNIEQQKRQMIAEESEDLRACLEDRDRFDAFAEEEVPSFRNRPLLDKEKELAQDLAQYAQSGAHFRILVVGGGEPQLRHQDKLQEYAEVMGFESNWRMAEYTSWHKEMDRLGSDMNTRFDALVILHWNRTTFTRRARKVCDDAGHKPCLTCYYEGFTSLRETMQTCLKQLLGRVDGETS
jgi:hypothetical protein